MSKQIARIKSKWRMQRFRAREQLQTLETFSMLSAIDPNKPKEYFTQIDQYFNSLRDDEIQEYLHRVHSAPAPRFTPTGR